MNVATRKLKVSTWLVFVALVLFLSGGSAQRRSACLLRVTCFPSDGRTWGPIPNPPSMTTDRSFNLRVPHFAHLKNGYDDSVHVRELLRGLNSKLLRAKCLVSCPLHRKPSINKINVIFHVSPASFHFLWGLTLSPFLQNFAFSFIRPLQPLVFFPHKPFHLPRCLAHPNS